MAANELFDTGIKITGSFSAAGAFPVDGKFVVETIAERDDHVAQNRAYEGMLVYVKADGKTYQYAKDGWKEFGFDTETLENSVYDGLDSDSQILSLSARQGKLLNTKITTHESNTDIHITVEEKTAWNAKADNIIVSSANDGLMSTFDKAKLDSLENYIHPETHPATMIVQDTAHRFVTDEQITAWDSKSTNKEDIGLGNVTNDAQVKRTEMGVAGGVATLDDSGKVPAVQLPSYVDDVVEYQSLAMFPDTGESDKIYVDTTENKTYRWSGTQYIEIGTSITLGETSSTAYAGDKGKALADEVAKIKNGSTTVSKAENANTVNGHTVAVDVPADAKFTDTTYELVTQTTDGLMAAADKVKLDGIEAGANNYVHPTGSNYNHVTDEQIAAWNAKASVALATQTTDGLMSSEDKTKLDGIEAGANNYVHPDDTNTRHVTDAEKATWNAKADKTVATISASGLMAAADKVKLDGIEDNANNYVHPNDTNTRHVTDAQIAEWSNKADKTIATTTANGLMSATDKTKLDSLEISNIENMTYIMSAEAFAADNKVIIPISDITTDTNITIGLDYTSITQQQYDAAGLAKFVTKIVETGIEVTCFGTVPSIDIPVAIAIFR